MDAATIWETLLRIRDEERGIYAEYDVTIIHAGGRKDQRQATAGVEPGRLECMRKEKVGA